MKVMVRRVLVVYDGTPQRKRKWGEINLLKSVSILSFYYMIDNFITLAT